MMTDEQIIKGLECCNAEKIDCRKCPYRFKDNIDECRMCFGVLSLDALSLVQRQKAEIERLRELNSMLTEAGQVWEQRHKTARADAVREFAEKMSIEIILALNSNYQARDEHIEKYNPVDKELYYTISGKITALRGISEELHEIVRRMTEGEQ